MSYLPDGQGNDPNGGIGERDLLLVQIDAFQRQAELATLRGDLGMARALLERMISGGR